jgi:probable phosphoglycerate mutase
MGGATPAAVLVRHGETAWSASGRHTGLTDIALTAAGEDAARRLGGLLAGGAFARVWTSPLQRARRTCELAGFAARALIDADLVEWDYGEYEGLRSAEILAARPGWSLFADGCPGGEDPARVGVRADRVVGRLCAAGGTTLVFASGHLLRVLAARWLGLAPAEGRHLALATASLSVLGWEHGDRDPAILLWNRQPDPSAAGERAAHV